MSVYITDYIEKADIESRVLCDDITSVKENAEVLLVWHQKIDRDYLSKFPKLKGIVRYGVGFDVIDFDAVRERNLIFCNTPDYGTDEVSDTVIAMLMNMVRGVTRYDHDCREYCDNTWQENTLKDLRRTNELMLGVVGAGRIGGSVLRKAKAIGIKTCFYDPYRERGYEKMLGIKRLESLGELLGSADIVSINTPLTAETRGMINSDAIKFMKNRSAFINTARGEIVSNLDIFVEPLKQGKLFGVALDVLPSEPPSETCELIKAWKNDEKWLERRLIINPHTSYYSKESYDEMRFKAASNAKRILNNKKPYNIIIDNE